MYTAHFGLRCLPFEDRAAAQFFHPIARHEEALAAMEYIAHYGEGIGLVLGEPGTGKTLLIRVLLSRLHATDHVVVITARADGGGEIVRECCKGFGVSLPSPPAENRLIQRLRRHLTRTQSAGHRSILVVDQAEHLTECQLGEIETLAELGTEHGRLLRLILAGSPRFRSTLERPEFARIRQQAFGEQALTPLSEEETRAYVRHRLEVAGAGIADFVEEEAIALIHAASGGVPRRINQICNAALLAAYGAGERRVTTSLVSEMEEVRLSGATTRSRERSSAVVERIDRAFSEATTGSSAAAPEAIADSEAASEIGIPNARSWAVGRAAGSRLSALIERAERVCEQLSRGMTRTSETTTTVKDRVDRVLSDAEERVRMLESRLADAASGGEEWLTRARHVERSCRRAEEVESRLTTFAGQLADRVEEVQQQVGRVLGHLSPAEEILGRMESMIGRAGSVCEELTSARESSLKAVASEIDAAVRDAKRTGESVVREAVERLRSELTREAEEFEQRTEAIIRTARASLAKASREQVSASEERMGRLSEALAQADGAIERLGGMQIDANMLIARMDADSTTARQTSDALSELVALSEQKIGQLVSTHSAASHVHERLGRATIEAHRVVEEAERTAVGLGDRVAESGSTIERLSAMREAVEREAERMAELRDDGSRVATELAGLVDQGRRVADVLGERMEESGSIVERLGALSVTTAAATDAESALKRALAACSAAREELSATIERSSCRSEAMSEACAAIEEFVHRSDASRESVRESIEEAAAKIARLNEAKEALNELIERYDRLDSSSREAVDRMDAYLSTLKGAVEGGEGLISEYLSRIVGVDEQLAHLDDRAAGVERRLGEAVEGVRTVIASAQSQSKHLEQVCSAVKKVFAGLSQAGLSANEQTEALRRAGLEAKRQQMQLVAETDRVTRTLQEWLQEALRVQSRLEQVLQHAPSVSQTHPVAPLQGAIRRMGVIERAASVRVADEPGAAAAREVRPGLDRPGEASRAEEIARLIAEARKSESAAMAAV